MPDARSELLDSLSREYDDEGGWNKGHGSRAGFIERRLLDANMSGMTQAEREQWGGAVRAEAPADQG